VGDQAPTYCTQKPLLFNTMVQKDPAGNTGGPNNVLAKRMKPSRICYPIRPRRRWELFTPVKLDIPLNAFTAPVIIPCSLAGSVQTSIVGRFSRKENSVAHCHWGSFRYRIEEGHVKAVHKPRPRLTSVDFRGLPVYLWPVIFNQSSWISFRVRMRCSFGSFNGGGAGSSLAKR